jgi:branched-chain amino acid aminotransferase
MPGRRLPFLSVLLEDARMSDARWAWRNGELIPWEQATVPLLSHALSRGSAVFEVFGTHPGPDGVVAFRMDEHLSRLRTSLDLLEMQTSCTWEELRIGISEVVAANRVGRGLVKILAYWGGEAVIDLVPRVPLDVAVYAIPDSDDLALDRWKNISVCISRWRKLHPDTVPVEAKACANYLNGYLARKDAHDRGFHVGLLVGTDGFLAEGSIEAVFLVKDGVLVTPPAHRILRSITRQSILEAAPMVGIPAREEAIRPDALFDADEVFTSHSGIKVSPVERVEDRALAAPGPVTRRLIELMDDIVHFRDDRFAAWFQPL